MRYYYTTSFYDFWKTVWPMIDYNYGSEEYKNDYIILGQYVNRTVEQLRQDIKTTEKTDFDRIIIYQLEPLLENHWHKIERILENIQGADEIWDYDLQNIEILHKHGINAKWRPIRYAPSLDIIKTKEDPEIDVLFVGTFTEHREKFFRDITRYMAVNHDESDYFDISFVWANTVLDQKLNSLIANSKVCLNLNLYKDDDRQKQTRIGYLLNNNKCVLSEGSKINYFGDSILPFTDLYDFKNKILKIMRDDLWKNPVKNFDKPRTKQAIFYHLDQDQPYWGQIFYRQFLNLQTSGLYDSADYIHLGVNGDIPLPINFYKINRVCQEKNHKEYNTLEHIWHFAKANPDYKILYLNSGIIKEMNNYSLETLNSYFDYIEHFLLRENELCQRLLRNYDCVGTEWIIDKDLKLPNFFGNSWWATGEYIAKLELSLLKEEFNHFSPLWLGMAEPKYWNFKTIDLVNKSQPIDPSLYR